MRVLLHCNPASGGATSPGEISRRLARQGATVVDDAPDRVVVAGGDGTVAQGAELAARLDVPLAVIRDGKARAARSHVR